MAKPLLSNSSIVWITYEYFKSWFILYKILSINLELFHREFQSITLQFMYNNLLHLSVALKISYSLLAAAELRDEITKNRVLTYVRCFGFHRVVDAKESRLSARPEPTQHKYWQRYVALNAWLSKDVTLSHIVYSSQHSQLDGIQNTLHTYVLGCFVISEKYLGLPQK